MITDFPALASEYAQLSGLLAGFAFAGLITLAVAPIMSHVPVRETMFALMPLIAVEISLVMSTVSYAMLAAEVTVPRTTSMFPVAATSFTTAGTMLHYSLLVLLVGVERDTRAKVEGIRKAVAMLRGLAASGGLLFIVILYARIRDHVYAPDGLPESFGPVDWTYWSLSGVPFLVIAFLVVAHVVAGNWLAHVTHGWPRHLMRLSLRPTDTHEAANKQLMRALSIAAVTLSMVVVGIVSLVHTFLPPGSAPPTALLLLLTTVYALLGALIAVSGITYGRSDDAADPHATPAVMAGADATDGPATHPIGLSRHRPSPASPGPGRRPAT